MIRLTSDQTGLILFVNSMTKDWILFNAGSSSFILSGLEQKTLTIALCELVALCLQTMRKTL